MVEAKLLRKKLKNGLIVDKWDLVTIIEKQQAEIESLKREKKSIVRNCIRICQSQNTIITTVTGTTHWGTITDAIDEIRSHYRKRKTQKK